MGFRKQYAQLAGMEVWERAARALLAGGVERLCFVVAQGDVQEAYDKVQETGFRTLCQVVVGGATRAQSVAYGLQAVTAWQGQNPHSTAPDGLSSPDIVAVHDAARPFVAEKDVRAVIDAAIASGAAVLGRRCIDTMKWVQDNQIQRTIERNALWHAQTPQVFRIDWLQSGFAAWEAGEPATDDSALMEQLGYPVTMVEATSPNPKLTTPEDLQFADWLAERKWRTT